MSRLNVMLFSVFLTGIALYFSSCSFIQKKTSVDVERVPASIGAKAWEVENQENETIVPDVFYSDNVQNEQIMPTQVILNGSGGGQVSYQINTLIYPTIGNPNLFVKGKENEELTVVLRAPPLWLTSLDAKYGEKPSASTLIPLIIPEEKKHLLRVYLVPRKARVQTEGAQSIKDNQVAKMIIPYKIEKLSEDGVPDDLRLRKTLILRFNQESLVNVNDTDSVNGLYDIRLEFGELDNLQYSEFQYNAVRVFSAAPHDDEYRILNVTDSQNSVNQTPSTLFGDLIKDKLSFKELTIDVFSNFIKFVNSSNDKNITQAAFVTFNGDLHNGGSPITLSVEEVSKTYNAEAKAILETLRNLNYPIFLTAGNHDGYVSMGHVPKVFNTNQQLNTLLNSLKLDQKKRDDFFSYIRSTENTPGGRHVDIFQGQYVRLANQQNMNSWDKIQPTIKNHVLYDGFYQWRKVYGPLYMSWSFGKNQYVNVNTYDLRQHSRSGWGMYTVNYGGNVSGFQMDWLRKELSRADELARDVIVLAHHDPRGGHKGQDYPFYFKLINYKGMAESATNFVEGEYINPQICSTVPDWVKTKFTKLGCLHDGLQEWMRADDEFDCVPEDLRGKNQWGVRYCDTSKLSSATNSKSEEKRHHWYSGYNFINQLAIHYRARTLLLGHTHFNSLEIRAPGTDLVPAKVTLDAEILSRLADADSANPIRALGNYFSEPIAGDAEKVNLKNLKKDGITLDANGFLEFHMKTGGHSFKRKLEGHELAILRLTSVSKLTKQTGKNDDKLVYGFSSFEIKRKHTEYDLPQINNITFFRKDGNSYERVDAVNLERKEEWTTENNPLKNIFKR